MKEQTEHRIECASGKLLARICQDGIKLWCDKHKREELFTWGQLEALRHSLEPPPHITTSDHTTALFPGKQ